MRRVIRSDDKIDMLWHVRFALDTSVQHAFVKRVLGKIDDRIADPANHRRDNYLLFLFLLLDLRLVGEFFRFIDTLNGRQ